MQSSPEMGNPFGPSPAFDPQKYRQDLAEKILEAKRQSDERTERAMAKGDKDWARIYREGRHDSMSEPLRLAKWSEEYQRARLLKSGKYTLGEHGEMIDRNSGLSTQELADSVRLFDSLKNDLDYAIKTLGEVNLPERILKSEKFRKEAQSVFWLEYHYGQGLPIEKAAEIIRFAQTFGIEEGLREIISRKLDVAAENNDREFGKKLIFAFPYFDLKEFNQRLESKFYPIPEGMAGKLPFEELFSDALEGEGEDISLDRILPTLAEKAGLLANDLKNNPDFYWLIKHRITSDERFNTNVFGRWVMLRDDRFADQKDRNYLRVLYFLGDDKGDPKPFAQIQKGPRLEFHFTCSKEDVFKESRHHDEYTTTKIFRFQGLYAGNRRIGRSWMGTEDGVYGRIDGEGEKPDFTGLKASKKALRQLAEELLVPEKDFRYSLRRLRSLAEKWGLPEDEVNDLSRAIKEFGTYMYRVERSNVGDCLITPSRFMWFCKYKSGVKLEKARYGEYHPEWGSSMGYDPYTFLHQVLVYAKRIVIDWTATQYGRLADKPIPYVYEIGEEREGLGPLYRTARGQTPNDQFIDDKDDPLYREEPPVEYGI